MIEQPAIIDRGRGPEIAGTRITVFHVLEYELAGVHRDAIASTFGLSSDQVAAALTYIREHDDDVRREYGQIRERIERGNPPWIEEKLRASHAKLEALREHLRSNGPGTGGHAHGTCVGQ